ncbi:MAG: hypothetical protein L0216_15605 [Planctomycetales bacterium]|nr:hypothetical protein [Planctomycetales bacterium]
MSRLGLATLALLGWAAGTASAQEWRSESSTGGGGGGGGGARVAVGFEVFGDLREVTVEKYEEKWIGTQAPPSITPTTPCASLGSRDDEEFVERRHQYYANHYAGMARLGVLFEESSLVLRAGVRLGLVRVDIVEESSQRSCVYDPLGTSGNPRVERTIESKTGFGGGIFLDLKSQSRGSPVWFGASLEGLVGQVAVDGGLIFGATRVDGEYLYESLSLSGRLGYASGGLGPYVGAAFLYYNGELDLEREPKPTGGSAITGHEATLATRSYIRFLLGLDLGRSSDTAARIEIGLWKPSSDLIVSLMASMRV